MIDTALRLASKEDMPFIYNSWLESYTENNRDFKRMGKKTYFDNQKLVLEKILKTALVIICCNREEPDQIFGYVVAESDEPVCHYVYVKYTYRKLGVCRKLLSNIHPDLSQSPLTCTFANKNFDILRQKYKLTYNPFLR